MSMINHSNKENKFVLSSNRLLDGRVVWYDQTGKWTETLIQAKIFYSSTELDQAKEIAQQDIKSNLITNLHSVELSPDKVPMTMREKIRAFGPSLFHPSEFILS